MEIEAFVYVQYKIFRNESRLSIESVDDRIVFNRARADHLCFATPENFNCSSITTKTLDSLLVVFEDRKRDKNEYWYSEKDIN